MRSVRVTQVAIKVLKAVYTEEAVYTEKTLMQWKYLLNMSYFSSTKFHCFDWIFLEWPSNRVTEDGTRHDWGSQSSLPKESFDKQKIIKIQNEILEDFWKGAFLLSPWPKICGFLTEILTSDQSVRSVRVTKKVSHILSPVLSIQYNNLMSTGCFPTILKIGKISPIYKKDNEEDLQNYRPISSPPIFGTIFEKVIYSQRYGFLSSQGILHNSQFGFWKGHITCTQLLSSPHSAITQSR